LILEPLHVLALPSSNEPAQKHTDAEHNRDTQKPHDEMRAHPRAARFSVGR
jgi:hypothetical protein